MASRRQILGIMAGASAPMGRAEMEEKVGESYRGFQTQLNRWETDGLIEDKGDHHYVLTEKGRNATLEAEFADIPEDDPAKVLEDKKGGEKEETQHTTGSTEFQQFLRLGKSVGVVPLDLIKVTGNHVWDGGDYKDLKWVAVALQGMGIQRDLASRWLNAWGSHLKLPPPADLPTSYLPEDERKIEEKRQAGRKDGAGLRNYILTEDNIPIHVADYKGDMDYEDVMELAKIRNTRGKGDGHPASAGSMADEVAKIFGAFKEIMGEKAVGKSYIIKPGEDGYQVEEVDPNKPVLIPQGPAVKPPVSYFVDNDGKVQEVPQGQPLIIMKDPPKPASTGPQYLINQRSGEVTEVTPGQPIIIKMESAPASQSQPLQMKDKDGNLMVLDLSTYIRLEEHREKERQAEESHQVKLEIAKGFKDLLKNAQSALSHMGEEEK